ncbi:aminotransferase-like domain-containing protein [Staphylococcus americanisciuri]|uniref:PLP-dependent aminotransferase family protein n=1 Tax=Staphylococcus americanisciuri TaxID=2973940 RepID=A0ABT2F1L2_9STAP|nr:PLP-dependent aminotransferase family protein [Staphylococcus americanisciuri]MCS4485745.1 PLP-dependent aminotransferase family protein [Staphylococcus americanisciuri]
MNKNKPKYQQIIDDIINDINHGKLEGGMKLPSQRALAHKYQVNRTTIVTVMDILKSHGIVESKERSGIYISHQGWNQYIHHNLSWQDYIGNSPTPNNQFYIREINRCEFLDDMVRLGTGELSPKLIPNATFKQIMQDEQCQQLSSNYEAPQGSLALREQIRQLVARRGISCDVDEICVTSGALQGLKLIADGLLIPESTIIVETPSYINSVRTWHKIHSKMVSLPISYIKNNIHAIFKEDTDYSNSIFYCNPTLHNPTANSYSLTEKEHILAQCKKKGIPVVEDDIYSELWFDGIAPPPLKSLDTSHHVLYLGSLSKTVSPGLRIGWIIGNKRVIQHLADLKMQNDYGASSISQYIATQWLAEYHEDHITIIKKQLLTRKQLMVAALKKYFSDIGSWHEIPGSFYIWFQLHVPIDMKKLFQLAINAQLLIHPGEIYSEKAKRYLRFSYSYIDTDKIDGSLCMLRQLIDHEKLIK